MEKIVFIDDDANVLAGLKRLLNPLKNRWEILYFTDPNAALKQFQTETPDVVITDLRLQKMDGVHFLDIISQQFPETIRIVLSGYDDEKTIFQIVKTAHQFIRKPVSRTDLINRVEKAIKLKYLIANKNLSGIIAKISSLPTLPENYFKLEKELRSEDVSVAKIGEIIKKDPSMAGEILRLVNSAFFSLPYEISDITQAISILGLNKIKMLVLYYEIFNNQDLPSSKVINIQKLWEHSIATGKLAQAVYKEIFPLGKEEDSAYVAGLLHDIGYLTISQLENYDDLILQKTEEGLPVYQAEYELFGISHAEVGAFILSVWNLPEQIIKAVGEHHNDPLDESESNLSSVVALANWRLRFPESFREKWKFFCTEEQFEKIDKIVEQIQFDEKKVVEK